MVVTRSRNPHIVVVGRQAGSRLDGVTGRVRYGSLLLVTLVLGLMGTTIDLSPNAARIARRFSEVGLPVSDSIR